MRGVVGGVGGLGVGVLFERGSLSIRRYPRFRTFFYRDIHLLPENMRRGLISEP